MSMSMSPDCTEAIRSASPPSWEAGKISTLRPTPASSTPALMTSAPQVCCGWSSV
jgi:hypothetical protein